VRAITFNVRRAFADDGEEAWAARREQAASLLRFHAPDVVAVQEAMPVQVEDLRQRLDYEWVGRPRIDGDEHTPVGYDPDRFALLDHETFWLSPTPETESVGWDGALPRIATRARLRERDDGAEWLVVSTHFDHEGERARRRSAELLAGRLDGGDVPTVLLGDLNCRPGSDPHRTLVAEGPLEDAFRAVAAPHGPDGTFHGYTGRGEKRIDYALVDGAAVERYGTLTDHVDGRYPSDHFPVAVDLVRT